MKSKYISSLCLLVSSLTLTSCSSYKEVDLETFNAKINENSQRVLEEEYTGASLELNIDKYELKVLTGEETNPLFTQIANYQLYSLLTEIGFDVDKDTDFSKGYRDNLNLTNEEFIALKSSTITPITDDKEEIQYFISDNLLKLSSEEEYQTSIEGFEIVGNNKLSLYYNEYNYLTQISSNEKATATSETPLFALSFEIVSEININITYK